MIYVHRATIKPPPFSVLVDDQGVMHPDKAKKLAAYLGVSVRTFQRWLAADDAPHAAKMAMWWVSRWGIGTLDTEIFNERQMLQQHVRSLQSHNENLLARVARLEALEAGGSANAPYFYPETRPLFDSAGKAVTPMAVAVGR